MKLVVGLGNPGRKYHGTRHNVGFDVLAELARRWSATTRSMHDAEVADTLIEGERVLLCAPQTFMNLSGRAVRPILDFYEENVDTIMSEVFIKNAGSDDMLKGKTEKDSYGDLVLGRSYRFLAEERHGGYMPMALAVEPNLLHQGC